MSIQEDGENMVDVDTREDEEVVKGKVVGLWGGRRGTIKMCFLLLIAHIPDEPRVTNTHKEYECESVF